MEIKEIKGYLDHKLKMIFSNGDIIEVKGIIENVVYYDTYERRSIHISHLKPLLRPLSDLTKEIEHNGEKFVPYVYLKDNFIGECLGLNPATWSHRVVEKLYEWKFDIHNLIEKGAAININTLK